MPALTTRQARIIDAIAHKGCGTEAEIHHSVRKATRNLAQIPSFEDVKSELATLDAMKQVSYDLRGGRRIWSVAPSGTRH